MEAMTAMRGVYLDNNATTPLLPEVFDALRPFFFENFGNASSSHERGRQARRALEKARGQVATLIGASPGEIIFTCGGTESDNMALFGVVSPGDHVITSIIEHHAVLYSCKRLRDLGADVTYLRVDGGGMVNPDDIMTAMRPNTRLISIMLANNETGVIQPVEEIGRIVADAGILFHTDAVQAAGKVLIDINQLHCDMLSLSGHKLHAPQGIGALYVRKGAAIRPLLYGGSQERGRRAGTENLPGAVALGKAAELSRDWLADGGAAKMSALRDRLEQMIAEMPIRINGASAPRVPNTSNITFDGILGRTLMTELDLRGITVSTGSACSSGSANPPHVLMAMGLTPREASCSVRFSLGKQTTEEDIDTASEGIREVVRKLQHKL